MLPGRLPYLILSTQEIKYKYRKDDRFQRLYNLHPIEEQIKNLLPLRRHLSPTHQMFGLGRQHTKSWFRVNSEEKRIERSFAETLFPVYIGITPLSTGFNTELIFLT